MTNVRHPELLPSWGERKECQQCGVDFIKTTDSSHRWAERKVCGPRCRSAAARLGHRRKREETFAARFWARVNKTAACWIWTKGLNTYKYGQVTWRGQSNTAHRVAWELTHGPIPVGLFVLHGCDNPPCVRPGDGHLFLGTAQDNTNDMIAKGRACWQRSVPDPPKDGER